MDKNSYDSSDQTSTTRPTPKDLAAYLPWACKELQVDVTIVPFKMTQELYVSYSASNRSKSKTKSKLKKQSTLDVSSDSNNDKKSSLYDRFFFSETNSVVKIYFFYDNDDNLVHIKFDKNKKIPRQIFEILGLVIEFQPTLTALTIKDGLDKYTLYEVSKFLHLSHITDICLDYCFLSEANYHLLLEKQSSLRQLSLSKCKINDSVVEIIASLLAYPLPASKTLSILNLSSNSITDAGAKYLAKALKCNRRLLYLNLMDNALTDDGANDIFHVLIEFSVSAEELHASKIRLMSYLHDKQEKSLRLYKELKAADFEKKVAKGSSKSVSPSVIRKQKGREKDTVKSTTNVNVSLINIEKMLMEKAHAIADTVLGRFEDPYNSENTIFKDDVVYCLGNNTLSYLNLAYNNLSYCSLKKLLEVLMYQKLMDRKPRGLVNLCIEGNYLPKGCKELSEIDDLLDMGLIALDKRNAVLKRRQSTIKGMSR